MFSTEDLARAERSLHSDAGRTQAIQRARDGSLVDIYAIVDAVDEMPELQNLEILEIFGFRLNASKIPDPHLPMMSDSPEIHGAEGVMYAFPALGFFSANTPFTEPIAQMWPRIFDWIVFFFAIRDRSDLGRLALSPDIVMESLFPILFDLSKETLLTTSGITPLVTSLWMEEDTSMASASATGALVAVLLNSDDDVLLDMVVETAGGKPDVVAELAISRLQSALRERVLRPRYIGSYADLMMCFSRRPQHPLRRALLRRGAVLVVTRALLRLTDAAGDDDKVICEAIPSCFGFIGEVVEARDGIVWIKNTIQEGLLRALVDVVPLFDRFGNAVQEILLLLEQKIPQYLMYRSVVTSMDAALRIFPAEVNDKMNASPMGNAWMLMLNRFALGRSIMALGMARGDIIGCHKCDRLAPRASLKRCVGCRRAWYCSKECQTGHWKEHKFECRMGGLQAQMLTGSDVISREDRAFQSELIMYEVRQNVGQLRTLAADRYPETPLSELGVRIEYFTIPPTLSLFLLNMSENGPQTDSSMPQALDESLMETMRSGREPGTLVVCVVPRGRAGQMLATVMRPLLWDTEALTEASRKRREVMRLEIESRLADSRVRLENSPGT